MVQDAGQNDVLKFRLKFKFLADVSSKPYGCNMTATVNAVYEDGVLKLSSPLPIKDKTNVVVIVSSPESETNISERDAWLQLSKDNLQKTWDNPADDVFNELLDR